MTNHSIPAAIGMTSEGRGLSAGREDRDVGAAGQECAVAANAAKVLETTRDAWSRAASANVQEESAGAPRAARVSKPKKRVVPRRSRWPSLVAALNYWSPKPL